MTADLVSSRLPLMEQHYQPYSNRFTPENCQLPYAIHPTSSSVYSTCATIASESIFPVGTPIEPVSASTQLTIDTNSNSTGVMCNNGAFRYQIRRPVESWKFVESRTTEGAILYLCRVCNSSYKHKKSLNKHWKDKHSDLPRPEGAVPDEDDDDGEIEDEDSDTELCPPRLLPATFDQYSGELSDTENRPPDDTVLPNQQHSADRHLSVAMKEKNSASISAHSRRYSTPHFRAHKPLSSSSRYSFVPQRQNFSNVVIRPTDQPHRKRLRHLESPQQQRGTSTSHERSLYEYSVVKDATWQVPKKRGELTEQASHNTSIDRINQYNASVNSGVLQNDSKALANGGYLDTAVPIQRFCLESNSTELSGGVVPKNVTLIAANRQKSPRRAIRENQPLDLSLQKNGGPASEIPQTTSSVNPETQHHDTAQKSKLVNKFLLIELLQTAINTLKEESVRRNQPLSQQQQMLSDDQHVNSSAFLTLSHNSISLLTAIGNLLVALVDKKPTCDEDLQVYGPADKSMMDKMDPKPVTRVLPPAPSTAIDCPAVDLTPQINELNSPHPPSPSMVSSTNITSLTVSHTINSQGDYCNVKDAQHHRNVQHPVLPSGDTKFHNSTAPINNISISQSPIGMPQHSHFYQKPTTAVSYQPISPAVCQSSSPFTPESTNRSDNPRQHHNPHLVPLDTVIAPTEAQEPQETNLIMCPVCKFEARWFSELRAHMVNHSDHRMFGCCYCNYRAKWKWDVAKHMRRCPLGRHVAHLTNEALLRMICYFPPPPGNILYNYFPQDEFPGVGIDRPPTPPNQQIAEDPSGHTRSSGVVKPHSFNQSVAVPDTSFVKSGTVETDSSASMNYQHNSYCRSTEFDEMTSPEISPTRLVIVDDEFPSDSHRNENQHESALNDDITELKSSSLGTSAHEHFDSSDHHGILKQLNSNTKFAVAPQSRPHDPTSMSNVAMNDYRITDKPAQ